MNKQNKNNKIYERIIEFEKCKNDFFYFCENYIFLELPGENKLFKLYKKQKELIELVQKDRDVLVLKSRQVGISTTIQAYACWLVVFFSNVHVGIISKDSAESTSFARYIMGMIDKLPKWMTPKFNKRTERSFILSNGCEIRVTPVNPVAPEKTLRGFTTTFLIIDEAAFISYIDEAWTSLVPSLSTSQKGARDAGVPYGTVILSTPNKTGGKGKWFFEKYQNAVLGKNVFKQFTIHWRDIEELANDPDWFKQQCALFDNDPRKIEQELELKFLAISGSFFDEKVMIELQKEKPKPIQVMNFYGNEAWMFKKPEKEKFYLIGVDTATEYGSDFSAISVWDYETIEQVFEFQGKLPVTDFIKVVQFTLLSYPGIVIAESNSIANQVREYFSKSEYSSMFYNERQANDKLVPGITTNAKTRPLMIDAMYSYITQFPEIVKSKRLAMELIGLIQKPNGKVEAESGERDDIVMSACFAFYVRKYDPPLNFMLRNPNSVESQHFNKIMNMNDGINIFQTEEKFNENPEKYISNLNSQILKNIKDNYDTGIINTFNFFKDNF